MSVEFIIEDDLGTSSVSRNIILDGVPASAVVTTEASKFAYYWRWRDEATMEPQFLTFGVVNQPVSAAFTTTSDRQIIFYQVSFDSNGQPNVAHPRDGKQYIYTPPGPTDLLDGAGEVIVDETGEPIEEN